MESCPRAFIGTDLIAAINMATMSGGGDWPVEGGLLDQAAWFLSLKQTIDNEHNRIESESQQT